MTFNRKKHPLLLVVIGLFGMSFYTIVARFTDLPIISNDIFQGSWYGICVGLELLGLYLLYKKKTCDTT